MGLPTTERSSNAQQRSTFTGMGMLSSGNERTITPRIFQRRNVFIPSIDTSAEPRTRQTRRTANDISTLESNSNVSTDTSDLEPQALGLSIQRLLEREFIRVHASMESSTVLLYAYYGCLIIGIMMVNKQVPTAYMDEIFHYPQTQMYCNHHFGYWDDKITTFPGLYYFGYAFTKLMWAHGLTPFCQLANLRVLNIVFAIGNAWLISNLRQQQDYLIREKHRAQLHALTLTLLPINVFFSFLYYTDTGSLFFVLLMYYFARRESPSEGLTHQRHFKSSKERSNIRSSWKSASAGAMAILFRQNNIIWVFFVLGTEIVKQLEQKHGQDIYGCYPFITNIPRAAQMNDPLTIVYRFGYHVTMNARQLARDFRSYLFLISCFGVFVYRNDGQLVLGDHAHHGLSFHLAQCGYCSLMIVSGLSLHRQLMHPRVLERFLKSARHVRTTTWSQLGLTLLALLAFVTIVVVYPTPTHAFMTADNRHYVFYVWKNWFLRYGDWATWVSIPVYVYCFWLTYIELRAVQSLLWIMVYQVALMLAVVPSALVECRYFLIPYYLYHVHARKQPPGSLVSTSCVYVFVNVLTLYVFLYRPFSWPDGSIARFMW